MNKELETKLTNVLKAEFDYVKTHENDKIRRLGKMNDIYHLQQIIFNFDDLELIIAEYLNKKAEKERWEK